MGIDIGAANGAASREIPIPATHVIGRDGRKRAEPADIVAALEAL